MENFTIHRCPKCDTINKGNVCIVCGEILSDNVQEKNVQVSPPKSNNYVKKYKILFFVLILLAILVTAVVTADIVEKRTSQMYIGQLEVTNTMNKNAQVVYSTALNYCLKSIENNEKLADGFYSFEIESSDERTSFDGTQEDFQSYFSAYYNAEYTQYCAVCVTNGLPFTTYWSTSSISNDVINISQEQIVKGNVTLGVYPAVWNNNTALTYIDKSSTNSNTETVEEENESVSDTSLNSITEDISDSFDSDSDNDDVTTDNPIAENIDDMELIGDDRFDYDLFAKELFNYVNERRIKSGVESVRFDQSLSEVAKKSLDLMIDGTYDKDAVAQYIPTGYTSRGAVYEVGFDLTLYKDEKSAAKAFLEYELAANDRELWVKDDYTVCYAYARENTDGTSGIIVVLMKN